jgi:hypothetical protein
MSNPHDPNRDSWSEWSRYVLAELTRLNEAVEKNRAEREASDLNIQEKLDFQIGSQIEKLNKYNEILTENTSSLKVHIAGVNELREQNILIRREIQMRIQPLELAHEKLKHFVEFTLKTMGMISAIVGFAYVVVKLIKGM